MLIYLCTFILLPSTLVPGINYFVVITYMLVSPSFFICTYPMIYMSEMQAFVVVSGKSVCLEIQLHYD